MKITWFIGNGFDINYGANTRYKDFYKWVIENNKAKDNNIFKAIEENIDSWSDFEKELCTNYVNKITSDIENQVKFKKDFDQFKDLLSEYLISQNTKVLEYRKNDIGIVAEETEKSIFGFFNYLKPEPKDKINNYLAANPSHIEHYFVVFNYTGIFENVISLIPTENSSRIVRTSSIQDYIRDITSIHGTIYEDMIMGFGEKELITNQKLLENINIKNVLVKTEHLALLEENTESRITSLINNSGLIIIYGMSLGVSDSNWWKRIIYSAINKNFYIIYFAHDPSYKRDIHSDRIGGIKDNIINKLCKDLNLDNKTIEEVRKRLIISVNADLFKYPLG